MVPVFYCFGTAIWRDVMGKGSIFWPSGLHLELRIWRSWVQASPVELFPLTRNFTPLCLPSPRCINGYRRHTARGRGLTLRWTNIPSRGDELMLLGASCYWNRDKLRPFGPLAGVRLYLLPYITNSWSNQLSWISQLSWLEHGIDVVGLWVLNPFKPNFFQAFFLQLFEMRT